MTAQEALDRIRHRQAVSNREIDECIAAIEAELAAQSRMIASGQSALELASEQSKSKDASIAELEGRFVNLRTEVTRVWAQMARNWSGQSEVSDGSMPSWIHLLNEALKSWQP